MLFVYFDFRSLNFMHVLTMACDVSVKLLTLSKITRFYEDAVVCSSVIPIRLMIRLSLRVCTFTLRYVEPSL